MRFAWGIAAVTLIAMPWTLRAATDSKLLTDQDRIRILLEYNQRLVRMTENYLKDRPRIPADYQGVSDKEYIRRYKLEKPLKIPPKIEVDPLVVTDSPVSVSKSHVVAKKKSHPSVPPENSATTPLQQ